MQPSDRPVVTSHGLEPDRNTGAHFDPYIRLWDDIGPPLRPNPSAIESYGRLFQEATNPRDLTDVLLLGVTPELAQADWLLGANLTALDHSPAMIAAFWEGDTAHRKALQGDWFLPPLAPGSQDVVLGDGVLNFFSYPAQHQQLASSIDRVLRDKGHLIIRAFCSPEPHLHQDEVVRMAKRRELSNFHEFKLLLLAALQEGHVRAGVELASVWQVFHSHFADANDCAQTTGWPINTVRTIDLYKDNAKRYYLATPREIEAALSEHFELLAQTEHLPASAMPTPVLCFRKR